jgi:hypothetical protein
MHFGIIEYLNPMVSLEGRLNWFRGVRFRFVVVRIHRFPLSVVLGNVAKQSSYAFPSQW